MSQQYDVVVIGAGPGGYVVDPRGAVRVQNSLYREMDW